MSEFINTVTEKNSEVLICFSGWSLQSISNEYDFEYIAKEDLRLQKIADSYLYEIRVSLFNYLEERIGSDEIKLQFSIWENVKFNVKILKSEWFQ